MFNYVLLSLKNYKKAYLKNDIISGIVVAALTIPVAMGYAQVAGLPPIYGLYASFLPILGYAIFASSPQMIFGIDATASAITGSILVALGIAAGSAEALAFVPMLAFFTGIFFILFAVLKVGKFVSYVSKPVMSGFISGISLSILVGQIPKMMGLNADGTDFFGNLAIIVGQFLQSNWIGFSMAIVSAIVILFFKKKFPKIPMSLIVLVIATIITGVFQLDQYNIVIVGSIPSGFPQFAIPDFLHFDNWVGAIGGGLVITIACFADSLLTSESFALQNKYEVDDNRELFAFGMSNFAAAISGVSSVSASVSRTAANVQFKGKTQLVSIVAAAVIAIVLLFLSGFLYYMPQPVLSAIIFAALVGVIDVKYFLSLAKYAKDQAAIWLLSMVGVLIVGVLFGVGVGVLLSFIMMIIKVLSPSGDVLGQITGKDRYYSLRRHPEAKEIPGVIIYRYASALYFANSEEFADHIKKAVKDDTKTFIFDASAMTGVDVSAAETLGNVLTWLDEHHIQYYFVKTLGDLVDDFNENELNYIETDGHIVATIDEALKLIAK
ncbi:SulP family inorganic anion transporter [Culicoidibacter larvae]|uniref:SulP family inorganic anion transporter n=1 Tax=Culicoidibacter larvae TaxID=2579976 RepID=A0A5R8QBB5_9FIRM|nr:SulP family inorganic anion transporter [Culicoidibacter larvae]TLG72949.1 SulP family inorganic anion transporter [Culicoidibacter larvae]